MKKLMITAAVMLLGSPAFAESSMFGGANSFVNYGTGMGMWYGGGAYATHIRSSKGVGVIWYPGGSSPENVPFNFNTGSWEPYNCCSN
jgi:hypothetical protein